MGTARLIGAFSNRVLGLGSCAFTVVLVAAAWTLSSSDAGASSAAAVPAFETAAKAARERAVWALAALALGLLVMGIGAGAGARWRTSDRLWLGSLGVPRLGAALANLVGLMLGALGLVALALAAIAGLTRLAESPADSRADILELRATAGPERAVVLAPGQAFDQALTTTGLDAASEVRVRLAPTFGGQTPTTRATLEVRGEEGSTTVETIARRTWVECATSAPTSISISNIGTGALAVIGPRPVEVWQPLPSGLISARMRSQLRVAARLWILLGWALCAAFAAGAWMRPGIAAMLAFSFLIAEPIGVELLFGDSAPLASTAPLTSMTGALAAVGEGRAPQATSLLDGLLALTALALAGLAFAGGVRRRYEPWPDEGEDGA